MTHKLTQGDHILHVDTLARVEGEGAMHVVVKDGLVADVELRIFEPPRFFEAFLRGRAWTEPPDITARICGICPVAYQMSSCLAIEDACGVTVPEEMRLLRRLLYCGEWIESHALHIYLLHAPDFLGYPGAIEMAADHGAVVERGLRLKKAGNALMTLVGGRAIHPVNVRVGGFYRLPTPQELRGIRPTLERARDDAVETVRLVAGFEFPDMVQPQEYVALRSPHGYPLEGGSVVTSAGRAFEVADFGTHVVEEHVARSNALHAQARRPDVVCRGAAGALRAQPRPARPARPGGRARRGAGRRVPQPVPVDRRPCRRARPRDRRGPADHRRLGRCLGAVRRRPAARRDRARRDRGTAGLLYHRYELAEDGTILDATIVPPTSQNQPSIEADLRAFVQDRLDLPRRAGPAVRAGDSQLRPLHLVRDALPRPHGGGAMTRPAIVIGLGNPDRGDDAVGVQVARQVAAERLDVLTLEFDDPSEALDAWDPEDTVIIADAISSGGNPGDIHVVDVVAQKLPTGNWSAGGTHALGLAAVVELARSLDLLPRRLVVVGVEAAQFDHGAPCRRPSRPRCRLLPMRCSP